VNIKVCDTTGIQDGPVVVPSDDGGVFISWVDRRDPNDWDIYVQKMDRYGNAVFQENGRSVCTASGNQSNIQMISDDMGGVILVWNDNRNAIDMNIYGQNIRWDGTVSWEENGTALTDSHYPSVQLDPRIIPDGTGGFLMSWVNDTWVDDPMDYFIREIYVQKFLSYGGRYWLNDVKIVEEQDHTLRPEMVSDGEGGAIILWEDIFGPMATDIFAQRVDGDGAIVWDTVVTVSDEALDQYYLRSIPDCSGGVISTWTDNRGGVSTDIYASRINSTGEEQWRSDGLPVCTQNEAQSSPELFLHDDGNIFVTWSDFRGSGGTNIYMQKIDPNGTMILEENGT
jgi:hypothetical protein